MVHRQLSELEVADQLVAVERLKSLPFVDTARIGVHGWSYGGYMTLNLMLWTPPGTFACGASGAPVTDWRGYETGYDSASILALADRLPGRLFIIHGTDDKTVMWTHSLAFVDRCIEVGTLVDYTPYPMQKHGIRGTEDLSGLGRGP